MKYCGICIGAANLTAVKLFSDGEDAQIEQVFHVTHEGDIFGHMEEMLAQLQQQGYACVALTGRKISEEIKLPRISEPEAVEKAFKFVNRKNEKFTAIVSMGAELFVAYLLDRQGNISSVKTLNKCGSGTGEFFMQQLKRMNLSLEQAVKQSYTDKVYRLSSRCSVFCKSDCTHALNKGYAAAEILAGLCEMMAKKVEELLITLPEKNVILIGKVTLNSRVVDYLKDLLDRISVPEEATYFEALGAALWAKEKKIKISEIKTLKDKKRLLRYTVLPPLSFAVDLVDYKHSQGSNRTNLEDEYILGVDAGSTTTKAVIIRKKDNRVTGSVYLRTNGNPVEATRNCYRKLYNEVKQKIRIVGLGVTGSGRQLVALHALTDGMVNEIIAHAKAAVYFEPKVDTIFEIGGQDAKYTHLTNIVPTDYAMNEACSAGTGSFLEESCKESLGIEVTDIQDYALKSSSPPNFNDQCAAFISSDIKTACADGLSKEDIVGGLVYSICINYLNRVKGNRIVGTMIFMQGGVCYNRAVPLAMASLLGKKIIVPPDPGMMGAFGVALEINHKLDQGILKKKDFDLPELINRQVKYHGLFKCNGAQEKCDRRCEISRIEVGGKIHLFGGACNKYYNLNHDLKFDTKRFNLVKLRQQDLFAPEKNKISSPKDKSIGINKSFLTHQFFPLYHHFFSRLGMRVVVSDQVWESGIQKKKAAFCYPAEIAHGLLQDLLEKKPDYIFLPQIVELKSKKHENVRKEQQSTCVILQGEPYYLCSTYKNIVQDRVLIPVIDFSQGYNRAQHKFLEIAQKLGFSAKQGEEAYVFACQMQDDFMHRLKQQGLKCLAELKKNSQQIAVVLLGRTYNAFSQDANKAIPDKFASRQVLVLPFDCLPYEDESEDRHMHWGIGQMLLKASRFTKKHAQLYAVFITNFSCGPDSFIVGQVREIMDKKPMLILEIDSHTADAGINTRIEAFLDIIHGARQTKVIAKEDKKKTFFPARCIYHKNKLWVISSKKERLNIKDPRVTVLIPPMGELGPQALAAAFKGVGISSRAMSASDGVSLQYGRAHTTCKECLPLILTTGSLIKYINEYGHNGNVLVYFMPTTGGNCRFGQYHVFIKNLIRKKNMKNIAIWTLDTQNSYSGLGVKFNILAAKAVIISDIMYDIKNTLKVLAEDEQKAMQIFNQQWCEIIDTLAGNSRGLDKQLKKTAEVLKSIQLKYPLAKARSIALMGEIYVRRDNFCCNAIIEHLAKKDFIVKTAPVLEWFYYVDYLIKQQLVEPNMGFSGWMEFLIKNYLQKRYERGIKKILAGSGLYYYEEIEIDKIIHLGKNFVSEHLTGESIVVIGSALKEILHSVCGVINVGPFACLPTRIIEAILNSKMNFATKRRLEDLSALTMEDTQDLPFLSIEIDGTSFPPLVDAKIEAFCLQAGRLHEQIFSKKRFPH
ncbi:MAG: acyl-CoA dehydratase activase [Candidatus Omnitrophota bacterium]